MTRQCTLGVGCEEAGVCYASAMGDEEECGMTNTIPKGHFRLHTKCSYGHTTESTHPNLHSALERAADLYGADRADEITLLENWFGDEAASVADVRYAAARRWEDRIEAEARELEEAIKEGMEDNPLYGEWG